MTQTGQNSAVRTRDEQISNFSSDLLAEKQLKNAVLLEDRLHVELTEAEARGAEEQRRKDAESTTTAVRDVISERKRQMLVEGWTAYHDDQYPSGQLAAAASAYAYSASAPPSEANVLGAAPPALWPWTHFWWKPTTPRRDLIKAGALILAEIERLDRAALTREGGE